MPIVTKREAAVRDLVEHYVYLAENASLDVAERFLINAEASFSDLARQPKIGVSATPKHADLANIRKWRINGFDNHLVFYLPRPDGVAIMRVLHAASDWWSLLGSMHDHSGDRDA
jgi:toxin ParE1/3/4